MKKKSSKPLAKLSYFGKSMSANEAAEYLKRQGADSATIRDLIGNRQRVYLSSEVF